MLFSNCRGVLQDLHSGLTAAWFRRVVLVDDAGRVQRLVGEELKCVDERSVDWSTVSRDGTVGPLPCRGFAAGVALEAYGHAMGAVIWSDDSEPAEGAEEAIRKAVPILARIAKLDYELDDLSAELADSYESIHLLCDVTEKLSQTSSTEELCNVMLASLVRKVRCRGGVILLPQARRKQCDSLQVVGVTGESYAAKLGARVPVVGVLERLLQEGSPLLMDHVLQPQERNSEEGDPLLSWARSSLMAVPLSSGGQVNGALVLFDRLTDRGEEPFDSQDRKLVDAAATSGAAMILGIRSAEFTKEMEIGQRIQRSLLPAQIPQPSGAQVAGMCAMAKVVGGDYYDASIGENGDFRAVIADVSGHDVGSALLMASARAQFRMELQSTRGPGEIAERVNAALYEDLSRAGHFLTFFVVSYSQERQELRYTGGGHPPMILLRANRDQPEEMASPSMPAGLVKEGSYPELVTPFGAGDLLLIYTDGLTETMDSQGEMFGEEGLGRVLVENRDLGAAEILQRVERRVHEFCDSEVLLDDGTALLLKASPASEHVEIEATLVASTVSSSVEA